VSVLEVRDPALRRLVREDAPLERIVAGMAFTEGPLWMGSYLLFSDLPNNRICKWEVTRAGPEVTTWRWPSGGDPDDPRDVRQPGSNGLTLDKQRRLIACEHGRRRVSRTLESGEVVTLADRYAAKRLNSPNDVVVRSDGQVFFSDPPYGLPNQSEGKEQDANAFYRVEPDGRVVRLVDDFERPNGLAFSPDERTIYLADTRRLHLRAFEVTPEGDLVNGRLFAEMANPQNHGPDGLKVDALGNVWCTGAGGVWVFAPAGKLLGIVRTPERPANCAFGGEGWRTLYVTAQQSVYRIGIEVAGTPVAG
jgi:gluconolactonase